MCDCETRVHPGVRCSTRWCQCHDGRPFHQPEAVTFQQYRKKDDVYTYFEAVQLTSENVKEVAEWCRGQEVLERDALDSELTSAGINVSTFQGKVRASENDYILKGRSGDFYVRKPGDFETTFELIE